MIPEFPEFKKIELADKEDVEQFTQGYLPYSDFNFISMYSWNISGEMRLSILNGNLVVRFTDYLTEKPFFSFIGNEMPDKTAQALIDFSINKNIEPILRFVPEEIAVNLDPRLFSVTEDRNSFDYIYDTVEHKLFPGTKFSGKRNEVNAIVKSHPNIKAVMLNLNDRETQHDMNDLYKKWTANKLSNSKDFEEHEEAVFNRLLSLAGQNIDELQAIGVYHDGDMLAFCIYEIINSEYALGHAAKSDTSIKGSNAMLMKCLAETLHSSGIKYFNFEQDLGLENLRTSKERFRPSIFLKKYRVTPIKLSTAD